MGRKNRRTTTKEQIIKNEQELRRAKRKLREWQLAQGHIKPVLAGFASEQAKGGF